MDKKHYRCSMCNEQKSNQKASFWAKWDINDKDDYKVLICSRCKKKLYYLKMPDVVTYLTENNITEIS